MRKLLLGPLLAFALCGSSLGQSAAVSTGYTYLRTPSGNGEHANLNGWYFIPSVNFNNWFGVLADFTSFYGTAHGSSLSVHGFTFGPIVSWKNSSRVTPVAFTEAGLVRSDLAGDVTDAFGWVVGGGFEVKMTNHVNLQIVPGEYVLTRANGMNDNNYTMKLGLTFPLKK